MESNTGLIIKLCVFALDIFIIIFNFITLKHYLPSFGQDKDKQIEMRNKCQQTYLAGDIDQKSLDRKQNYAYRSSANNLISKNIPQNSSYGRPNPSQILRHCQKYYSDRDYRKEDKYSKSICHCDFCKEGKRGLGAKWTQNVDCFIVLTYTYVTVYNSIICNV